jgi:chromosome segregation ATPase
LPEQPTEQDTAKFLRRFSELVAIGHSASYLRHAAGLIDELIDRITRTEAQLDAQIADNAEHLAQRHRADAEAQAAREALALREQQVADLAGRLATTEDELAEAQARGADADAELTRLRGQLASIGRSHALVPMQALRELRAQFAALSGDFRGRGDLVSGAMCQVGICAIDQMLAGATTRRPIAIRASA